MKQKNKPQQDYHDYVIKDGKIVGRFEEMYQECPDPWPETTDQLNNNPIAQRSIQLIRKYKINSIFSFGSGKGLHLDWLGEHFPHAELCGCDISPTAVRLCEERYPRIKTHVLDTTSFFDHTFNFDVIIFREVTWYILPHWQLFCKKLKQKYQGRYCITELSFYDKQSYGIEYFNGPEEFISTFPFHFIESLRHHSSPHQREGMLSIFSRI